MPIINAAASVWLTGQIYNPSDGLSYYAVFSNFSSKQISDRSAAADIAYGSPYEKIWDIGHTYWQTDFTCPILLTESGVSVPHPYYDSKVLMNALLKTMISVGGFKSGDAFTAGTLKNKWDFNPYSEIITSNNADYVIQKMSIDLSEDDATFSATILSTMDIRKYFQVTKNSTIQPLIDNKVYRLAKPFDITIPVDCIGAPFGFRQSTEKQWPIFTANSQDYSSLLRELHISLEANTIQVPTIGMPASRTFLGVNSLKCSGNIKYIPLYFTGGNIIFQDTGAAFSPAGWIVDLQSIDYIQNSIRHGGKLYVSMDMINPIYVQVQIRNNSGYFINGKDADTPLGPVSTTDWSLTSSGGSLNEINVNFVTNPGVTSF